MSELIRKCPSCSSERSLNETHCENLVGDLECKWPLITVLPSSPATESEISHEQPEEIIPPTINYCLSGHEVADGDLICFACGAEVVSPDSEQTPVSSSDLVGQEIGEWIIESTLNSRPESEDSFMVRQDESERKAFLILYKEEHEPDQSIYQVMETMDIDHIPELITTGRWQSRPYEIHEWLEGGALAEVGYIGYENEAVINEVIRELTKALLDFSKVGLRHRDINPHSILIREKTPLDLVITDFGSARLSDFDLDVASPLELTRYSAPEAIVGAISAASDWWSLGMIVLEQATNGECFQDINEKAFLIHVVTRGIDIPENIQSSIRNLLCGLLARDPNERWKWEQVNRWLNGEHVELPRERLEASSANLANSLQLGNEEYYSPEKFSLAASESSYWDEGLQLLQNGSLETWLRESGFEEERLGTLRRITGFENLDEDIRFSLALMVLNDALPMVLKGEIITPAWLTQNAEYANLLVFGEVPKFLESISRELWLSNLKHRGDRVLNRAKTLEIQLDEFLFQSHAIITSRAKLEVEESLLRQSYPDSDHAGLASLLHRKRLNEEDLLVLLCARRNQFTPLTMVLERSKALAEKYDIGSFDGGKSIKLLTMPRAELHHLVDDRIADFSRCGIERIDDWADTYRIERRLPLPRIIVLLSVDEKLWTKPEKQQYKENIIKFYERRVVNSVLRGPLVRLTIGKTSAKIDLTELGTELKSSDSILSHILDRNGIPTSIDPEKFANNVVLQQRIRRLINQSISYRRETGIDSLFLGFPFLLMKSTASPSARPRIIPILLWPIVMDFQSSGNNVCNISFDKEREEIRLNPALEGLLGTKEFNKFKELKNEMLGRSSVRNRDVVEVFSSTAKVLNFEISTHPSISYEMDAGSMCIECSAVLFNAKFVGQAISEDLRQLRKLPVENTALDPLIKMSSLVSSKEASHTQLNDDKFSVVPSDPSQDSAINLAREKCGVVIEGPPGTGKSQTIVNIIADCVGRGESVLVVCQKQAALNVVRKRLEAENLAQRICGVIDINRDRQPVIKTIREQIEQLFGSGQKDIAKTKNQRTSVVKQLENLESDINKLHDSIYQYDERLERTYRDIICELIAVEDESPDIIPVPELRRMLSGYTSLESKELERICVSLSNDWLHSDYENSPFKGMKLFSSDESIVSEIKGCVQKVYERESEREALINKATSSFDDGNVDGYKEWQTIADDKFKVLTTNDFENISKWNDLFFGSNDHEVRLAKELHQNATAIKSKLQDIHSNEHTPLLFDFILQLDNKEIVTNITRCKSVLKQKGRLSFINIFRIYRQFKLKKMLEAVDGVFNSKRVEPLRNALALELKLRPLRKALINLSNTLNIEDKNLPAADLPSLKVKTDKVVGDLRTCLSISKIIYNCPRKKDALSFIEKPSKDGFREFRLKMLSAIKRAEQRQKSIGELSILSEWFTAELMDKLKERVLANKKSSPLFAKMKSSLKTLVPFQSFRLRSQATKADVFTLFAILRDKGQLLMESESLENAVSQIIHKETLLAWKGSFEEQNPLVLSDAESLERATTRLNQVNNELTNLNKMLLSQEISNSDLGNNSDWESITRLRGPRTKKLREFIDLGNDMGLMKVRPVWLMNPEVVSQVLPLKAGLFDVVIFDEASQMLVDHSIPSLYRAKRVVISGDEKQMPPSSSFTRKVDTDEDEIIEELDEDMSEAEISALEEAWNRKEIKDCPDLLALGRSVLPYTTLQIHYRSEYNALIEFSNYAFYSGKLNVPAKHPLAEIKKVKPVEVIHTGGVYIDQTNPKEGERVIELLKKIWLKDNQNIPSIGVVTFNIKQAELIEGMIQVEASQNEEFSRMYLAERDRVQNGEDMGFFVKNVENVQGDERDYILFSTTFGLNQHGAFRRNFGALGHKGGEKRLNVAITRARQKVVIVTSMPIDKISDMQTSGRLPNKPRDYIQAYLDYADKKSKGEIELAKVSAKQLTQFQPTGKEVNSSENLFIKSVETYVKTLGCKVVHANDGDAFGLDLAIENPATGLFEIGIECDAPRHELLKTATAREIWRKQVLQRSVRHIHRIRCNRWYRENESEKAKLKSLIEQAFAQSEKEPLVIKS